MLLKTGELTKLSRSKDQLCTFFLFSDSLVYAKKVGWKYKLSQVLPIDLAFHVSHPKTNKPKTGGGPTPAPAPAPAPVAPTPVPPAAGGAGGGGQPQPPPPPPPQLSSTDIQFEIVSAKKSFSVMAKDAVEKKQWFDAIQTAAEIRRKILAPNKTDKHGTAGNHARPVWQQDKTETECPLCSKEFGLLTRRHHCRKWYIAI